MAISIAGNQSGNDRFIGTGTPESNVTAGIGTKYIQTDGVVGSIEWLKESGTGSTGWRATALQETPNLDVVGTVYRANMSRLDMTANLTALTTQVMTSVAVYLYAGDVVTNISFLSGATAAGTPLHWWFALYSNAATPALMSQSVDVTTTAWAANTTVTLSLGTPQTIATTGIYYAAVAMQATTTPTLAGITLQNAASAGAVKTNQKVLARTSGSSLLGTAPATITSPTTVATVPFVVLT